MRFTKMLTVLLTVSLIPVVYSQGAEAFDSGSPNTLLGLTVAKNPPTNANLASGSLTNLGFISGFLQAGPNFLRHTATGFEVFQTTKFDTITFGAFESALSPASFGWELHSDSGGVPGALIKGEDMRPIADTTLNASYAWPNGFGGSPWNLYTFTVPAQTLAPGKYWISVYADEDTTMPTSDVYFAWAVNAFNGLAIDNDARSTGSDGVLKKYTGLTNRYSVVNLNGDAVPPLFPVGATFDGTTGAVTSEGTAMGAKCGPGSFDRYQGILVLNDSTSTGGNLNITITLGNYKSNMPSDADFFSFQSTAGTSYAAYNIWLFPPGATDLTHAQYCLTVNDSALAGSFTTPNVLAGSYDVIVQPASWGVFTNGTASTALAYGVPPTWLNLRINGVTVTDGATTNLAANLINGDVNLDGVIDDFDLTDLIVHFGEDETTTTDNAARIQYDLTGDGIVDDFDLTAVILGFGDSGPCPGSNP